MQESVIFSEQFKTNMNSVKQKSMDIEARGIYKQFKDFDWTNEMSTEIKDLFYFRKGKRGRNNSGSSNAKSVSKKAKNK